MLVSATWDPEAETLKQEDHVLSPFWSPQVRAHGAAGLCSFRRLQGTVLPALPVPGAPVAPGDPLASARMRCSARVCVSPLTGALVVDSSTHTKPRTLLGGRPSLATLQRPHGHRGPPVRSCCQEAGEAGGKHGCTSQNQACRKGFGHAARSAQLRLPVCAHHTVPRTGLSSQNRLLGSPLSDKQQAVGWWGSLSPDPRATTPSPAPQRALERVWGALGPGSGCPQMGAATLRVRTRTLGFCHFPMSPNTGFSSPATCKCEDSP